MYIVPVLQAAAQQGGILGMVLPIALIFVIFYVFIIRPQNKKQKETQKMIDALKKGDKVVTIGGIHGVISSVKDQTVIVKVDDDAKIEFTRSAVASVIVDKPAKEEEKPAEKSSFFSRFKKSDDGETKTDSAKN
ncbi:preprotein translocase, YajC subunit [Treponema maltophilum ATCC 51939]|uniref:Sec translocon accessory complex subunit YajC n=1 Tax=Treponema maltophilum ATCC 51939 TaxID=1125699 RepID=S3KEF7_TREMA|nr:preprotein translocase subunit YajC [Treponema maltophilum]EPF30597.1 preprotein translocase, YajC subunit [Treponema maltophilum ATCC 51939]